MLTTPHVLVGGLCGVVCGMITRDPILGPIAAFCTGFVSHLLLDLVPHHDPHNCLDENKSPWLVRFWSIIDIMVGVGILVFLLKSKSWPVFHLGKWGAIGGMVIDMVDNVFSRVCPPFGRSRVGQWIRRFHETCHTHTQPKRWFLGTITQVISSLGSIMAFYFV